MPASQSPGLASQVQGLERSYKELQVLRGGDFDVERGSIFALLGSNGAGKTTVVKILSTLLKADAGAASVNGSGVTTQLAKVRESIGGAAAAAAERAEAAPTDTAPAAASRARLTGWVR
jgi:ABC-2 type transport system ATP-binding protein